MQCTRARAQLSAYLDNELGAAWRRAVHGHLLACTACSAVAQDMAALRQNLQELPDVDVPPGLYAQIQTTLAQQDVAHSQRATWRHYVQSWLQRGAAARGVKVGFTFAVVAAMAMAVATLRQGGGDGESTPSPALVAAPPPVDSDTEGSDDEAVTAYLASIRELREAVRGQLRLGNAEDAATWQVISTQLDARQLAFSRATSASERREIAAATAAYLGEAFAQTRTDELLARSSW